MSSASSAMHWRNTWASCGVNRATYSCPERWNMVMRTPSARWRSRPALRGSALSWLVDRGPQPVAVQAGRVILHPFASARGDDRLALVVHVEHQLLGLVLAVPKELLQHPRDVGHQVDRIVPDDRHPCGVDVRYVSHVRYFDGHGLRRSHATH